MKGLLVMRRRRWGVRCLILCQLVLWISFGAATHQAAAQIEIVSDQMFLIASEQGPDMHVLHLLTVRNVGFDEVQEILLPVPLQATEIVANNVPPESLGLEATRVVDQRPIAPGESRNYVLQYELPVRSIPFALQRNMPYPADLVTLWVDSGRYRAMGVGPGEGPRGALRFFGYETLEGVTFGVYQMEGVPAVDVWQVVLEPVNRRENMRLLNNHLIHGDPGTFFASLKDRVTPWLFPWGLVLVGGVVGVLLMMRRRAGSAGRPAELPALRTLKDSLVDLDMRFRRREIDEIAYREMRSRLKEEALALMEREARRTQHSERSEAGVKNGV